MKMKYTAAFALVAWLLVTGWLASMVIAKPAVLRLGNQAEETAAMAELRNAINRNHQASAALVTLSDNQLPIVDTGNVVALPVAAVPATNAQGMATSGYGNAGAGADAMPHAVSLVLVGNGRRVAVIDGQYVQIGSRLADGTRVRAIGPDWVRLTDPAGNPQTYRVLNPLQPTQAGGHP
jgi:hypothetical protein